MYFACDSASIPNKSKEAFESLSPTADLVDDIPRKGSVADVWLYVSPNPLFFIYLKYYKE